MEDRQNTPKDCKNAEKPLPRLADELIKIRRDLHRIPELDRALPKTEAYIKQYLSALPCRIIPAGDTGFCAFFKAQDAETAETVAFRSDMDALPIDEVNEDDYRSVHAGRMHACGHDGHMSILLGLAHELAREPDLLRKNVLLIFQAAEETTGGAKQICASGVLKRCGVNRVYGLHLWPEQPKNAIICRKREFMASTMVLRTEITGKSAHVAHYENGVDALEIGCAFVNRLYAMEKSEVAPEVFRLLRFGVFQSGRANNVVSNHARLEGTLRTYGEDIRDFMWNRILQIAEDLMQTSGCRIDISHSEPYPAVINDDVLFDGAKTVLEGAGYRFLEPEKPLMVSEDFSWYQRYAPGLFLHLGTGVDTPLHSNNYRIDEETLLTGVNIFKLLLNAPNGTGGR
ncbi:MAG: amidohydrolase [Clostridiales Family XIII bacterium]|jgi:hippurate hydrolase|nr:amidohydrolase [Clostridiales Family XIII bacterium]